MKSLRSEFRMFIAEKLLSLAFSIAPSNEEQGRNLKAAIINYFDSYLNENNTHG
jgi:hypothetical protein